MRYGENNHNVHDMQDSYEEEMTPSSDVNDTDKDESKQFHRAQTFSHNFIGEYMYGRKRIRMQLRRTN